MDRRNFIKNSIGASIAGPLTLHNVSSELNRSFWTRELPSVGIESPHETKLVIKPLMTNMFHTAKWEGPCRFNVVTPEEEKKGAINYFEGFKKRIAKNEIGADPDNAAMLEPELLLFVEDFKLKEEDLKKIEPDVTRADAMYVDPSGSSIATFDLAKRFNKPVILSAGFSCRTVDISSYCRSQGLEVFIPNSVDELNEIIAILRARKVLSHTRILYPTNWGWPSVASVSGINDPYKLKDQLGVELVKISYDELAKAVDMVTKNSDFTTKATEMAGVFSDNAERSFIDRKFVVKSMQFYLAVAELMKKYNCNAFTIECFEFCASRLPEKWTITPCSIHTMLKDLGIPSACEGDLGGLLSMHMLMALSKKSSHLGNMFYASNGVMEINHSAPGIRMNGYKKPDLKYQLGRFVESGWGTKVMVDFMQNEEKNITVARMNPQATGLLVLNGKLTGSKGTNEDLLGCSVSAFIVGRDSGTAEEFVKKQSDYGNHLVWVYGDYSKPLERLGKLLGLDVQVIS